MNRRRQIASFIFNLLLLLSITSANSFGRQTGVLAEGFWVKMTFQNSGVYKIDRPTLSSMGFDINTLDPRQIQVFGIPGGMLPQENNRYTTLSLQQLSIQVIGEADGSMDADDQIIFYVDGPQELKYTGQTYQVIKNLYSDEVHYFITIGSENGERITSTASIQGDHTPINHFDRVINHEIDEYNILGSGREWYGEQIATEDALPFVVNTDNLNPDENILITITAMAQSFISSSMNVSFGGQDAGELNFNAIPDARYGIKGNQKSQVFTLNSRNFSSNTDLNLSLTLNKNGQSNAIAYLNHFVVELPTVLTFSGTPFSFRSKASLKQTISRFNINTNASALQVWNVTNTIKPGQQGLENSTNQVSYGAFSNTLQEYVAFAEESLPLVTTFNTISNQDLMGMTVPDMVIITTDLLQSEATRLASFRSQHDGLEVAVVNLQDVYNEFSAGRQDLSAIRNFARYLKNQSSSFKYLLLFGKGSYDYKDRIENNTNLIPTYEARNSLHPLLSFSSDDYFGFLDEDEGLWAESGSGDHMMDIGVGRIPATSIVQARTAVDKIVAYQTDPRSLGDWRSRIVFVADDGDNNTHQEDADFLATLIDTTYQNYNITKLYLDAFEQEIRPNGEFSPDAVNALLDEVDKGALIINFTGHGAETGWTQERVLTTNLIDDWDNTRKLPLLVTATCEFGRNDDPTIFSGAEKMMFKEDGGALALITTARPVFSSTNYDLNLALYGSILEPVNDKYPRLGDVIQFTKNNSLRGSLNRNFILLGDPSMRIAYPDNQIRIESINNNPINEDELDTLKALQKINIAGIVESNNQILSGFNGTVKFNLFDKSIRQQTNGTESDVFEFYQRNSTLFSGTASVIDGQFEIDFVVPKNINYQFGSGKMTFYAVREDATSDAIGASADFILGGTDETVLTDNQPPQIRAFLNDTLALSNYIVKPDVDLVLLLTDENGINISKSGIGQDIIATLNDSVIFLLNDFYSTAIDDFTIGMVSFPMRDLPIGQNELVIQAWDTHNNSNSTSLMFQVTDENSNTITEINAYPNPFINNMTFAIAHNSAGQSIELVVEIFNQKGEKVTSIYQTNEEAGNVESVPWNGTDNTGSALPEGIYVYNILLRSENTEIVHSTRHKLIISN